MAFKIPPICKDPQEFPMHPECIDRLMSLAYDVGKAPEADPAYKEYLKSNNTDDDKIVVAKKLVEIVKPHLEKK